MVNIFLKKYSVWESTNIDKIDGMQEVISSLLNKNSETRLARLCTTRSNLLKQCNLQW